MKYLFIMILFSIGCNADKSKHSFKVGDCITSNHYLEAWENPDSIFKILEVGKYKYRTEYIFPAELSGRTPSFDQDFDFDKFNKKIECPK